MREVPVTAAGAIDPEMLARLQAELRRLPTLGDVLSWSRAQHPPAAVAEIVTQDEYTHDVIVTAAGGALYLAFDTN